MRVDHREVNHLANIKSAKKRIKVTARQAAHNRTIRSTMRTATKKAFAAMETKSDDAATLYQEATVILDRAVGKNIIHKNAAARKKSQLTKAYNLMNA